MTVNTVGLFKYTYSICLLLFSITLVMALIFTRQTKIAYDIHPAMAFILLWVALIWLSMVEGSQASLVGLPPIDRDLYTESHPRSKKVCELAHKGDNLDRYLMGRQFMVLVLVFVVNNSGAPLGDAEIFNLPNWVYQIFLGYSIAMILMTANIGQLSAQVNASRCMLDYVNNNFAMFTLYVTLAIEWIGLLHSCYLVQYILSWLSGKPIDTKEPPRSIAQNIWYWVRVCASLCMLVWAFAVSLAGLFQGKTTMWKGVPSGVSVVLFFILMGVVGMLEGMQIAFFAVAKLSEEEQAKHPIAKKTCHLLFKGHGHNLPGFMVGRQICVTLCFFFVARVTSLNVDTDTDDSNNIFGANDSLQKFYNTGLLGAFITTIVASITWQLAASAFPVAFLSNPLCYVFLRICLLLEATGICAAAWFLAMIHKRISGFKFDEVYVGTAEERAARNKADDNSVYEDQAGHLYLGPAVMPGQVGAHHEPMDLTDRVDELERKLAQLIGEKQEATKAAPEKDLEMQEANETDGESHTGRSEDM